MSVEAELAQLLIRMGTDRGLDVETILAEMAQAPLPSFVDADAVRGSMLEAVESWWRADLEERLGQLRQQFQMGASPVTPAVVRSTPPPPVAPRRSEPVVKAASVDPKPPTSEPVVPVEDATIHGAPELPVNEPAQPAEVLPRDATMIWNTNHG